MHGALAPGLELEKQSPKITRGPSSLPWASKRCSLLLGRRWLCCCLDAGGGCRLAVRGFPVGRSGFLGRRWLCCCLVAGGGCRLAVRGFPVGRSGFLARLLLRWSTATTPATAKAAAHTVGDPEA